MVEEYNSTPKKEGCCSQRVESESFKNPCQQRVTNVASLKPHNRWHTPQPRRTPTAPDARNPVQCTFAGNQRESQVRSSVFPCTREASADTRNCRDAPIGLTRTATRCYPSVMDTSSDSALLNLREKLRRGALEAERGELLDADEVFADLFEMIEDCRRPHPLAV